MPPRLAEEHESLWEVTAAPLIWAAHFILSYLSAAIFCAKLPSLEGSLDPVRTAIGVYTVVALSAVGFLGARAARRHRRADENAAHHEDKPESRHRFLAFTTLLLSGLSAVAIVYSALAAVFIRSCE